MNNEILLILSFGLSFVLTVATGFFVVRWLKKMKAEQIILEDAPETHKSKEGTPTMGGIMFLAGIVITCVLLSLAVNRRLTADIITMMMPLVLFAVIGILDDWVKITNGRNLGLTARQKLLFQIVVAVIIAVYQAKTSDTLIYVPIAKIWIDLGVFYIPFVFFFFVAMVNAVNLNDGLDGLAAGCTGMTALFLALTALSFEKGSGDIVIYTAALTGGCAGFLVYNHYPAKVFMGDTGSLSLGGALAVAAVMMHIELIIVMAGLVFVLEALSVIIQVGYFKYTRKKYHLKEGKRVFKKTPLHHHFEEGGWTGHQEGWKETKVVALFWCATAVCCVIAWFMM